MKILAAKANEISNFTIHPYGPVLQNRTHNLVNDFDVTYRQIPIVF